MRRFKKLPKKQSPKPSADEKKLQCHSSKNLSDLGTKKYVNNSNSSSESDIESYLKPASQIDLDSSFFQTNKPKETTPFEAIEKNIFAGINRLNDFESDPEENEIIEETTSNVENSKPSKINFQQLYDYTKKVEDTKKLVEVYEKQRNLKQNDIKCKNTNADELNVSEILALGETKVDPFVKTSTFLDSSDFESHSDSEKDDWEEVQDDNNKDMKESIIPKDGVQITVNLPGFKQKKKGPDLLACMKRRLNRVKKENQIYIHKVHLLCWIAHGNYVNRLLNEQNILSFALSLIPSQHCYPSGRTDLTYLEQIVRWYRNSMPVRDTLYSKRVSLIKLLKIQINKKEAFNRKMLVYIFICMLRSLGIQCRLVISFQVAPLRPPASELHSLSTKAENETSTTNKANKLDTMKVAKNCKCDNESVKSLLKQKNSKKQTNNKEEIFEKKKDHSDDSNVTQANKSSQSNNDRQRKESSKQDSYKKKIHGRKGTRPKLINLKTSSTDIPQLDGVDDTDECVASTSQSTKKPKLKNLKKEKKQACSVKVHPKRLKSIQNRQESLTKAPDKSMNLKNLKKATKSSSASDVKSTKKEKLGKSQYFSSDSSLRSSNNFCNDIISIMKGRIAQERAATQSKLVKSVRHKYQNDYDSDYAPESIKKRSRSDEEKVKVKRRVKINTDDDNDEEKKKKQGVDVWVEIFLESEERWISADVVTGNVHCVGELYSRATHPVTYIIAWNNNNTLKDITQRYCRNWNTVTRKLRIDKKWLQDTLSPFEGQKTIRDKEEDEELAKLQSELPLPTSIAEYKNHPLYALKRHLLKFQALYPPEPITLGFIKDEPVYSRDCVHVLHSREVWIKYAKVVRRGEEPYKIVKARSKYDKLSGQMITDKPLELFGKWQVEDYIPPTAENGIVPRNAFGNVELFKSCMLPKGTVHLQLPGLNKVAKKLNIDCAPAVVGFDFHTGGSHPTFDGFVVCEEYSDILVAAWYTEQEEQEKREQEKIQKRVYDNWKKLIKGLLIRERLKAKYDFGDAFGKSGKKRNPKAPKLIIKKRRICTDSESD